jgi:anti-sigma regulatory factor (Ser/Thr protein kinase)
MVQRVAWSDRVTLVPTSASVPAARAFIQGLLIDHGLLYLVEDVRLVTSELATNAARYAKASFTVLLEGLSDSVRLTVTHDCAPRPVLTTVPVMATAGRGLNIVGYYSSDWGVSEGKRNAKSVWASFDLRQAPSHPLSLVPNHQPGRTNLRSVPRARTFPSPSLSRLRNDVQLARGGLRTARSSGRAELVPGAQAHLVASLTDYVEALSSRRLPVPYLLRDELRLYGRTTAAYNATRGGRA